MSDTPPDPNPDPDTRDPDIDIPGSVPTEVPGEGGFNDGEVEIEEPLEDEIPPV